MLTGLEAETEVYDLIEALVRATRPAICVETGTAGGVGSHRIARALDANGGGHLWTVDHQPCKIEPHERITQVEQDSLAFVRGFNQPVEFAFVDCCFGTGGRRAVVIELLNRGAGLVLLHDTNVFPPPEEPSPDIQLATPQGLAIWQGER